MSWKLTAARILDDGLRLTLSPDQRIALGNYISTRASGDGNADSSTNGEMRILRQFATTVASAPVTVFDVGANSGRWARGCVRAVGSQCRIFAFEPVQATFDDLRATVRDDRHLSCVSPVMAALSDRDGEGTIFVSDKGAGEFNSLYRRHTDEQGLHFDAGGSVPLMRGDTFCTTHGIDRIAFLKIDTEGHEISVLKGFTSMLAAGNIDVIQFEYGGAWLDSRTQLLDAFELLRPLGYLLAKIRPNDLAVFEQYDQAAENFRYSNYLAFRPELKPVFAR